MVIGTPTVLNLIPGGVMKVIHVNQVNENIEIQFRIMNGAQPFNVPEGVSCTIRGTKGDNFGYAAAVDVTAGSNIVTVTLTEQLTAVAGAGNVFELVFVGASDNMKVSTENFILEVERAALGEDTVISDSDLAYADQVLDQLQSVGAVNAQVQQNKANIAAEITRATAAEQTLQQNINAEAAARQAADNTLQSNINAEASSRATTDASLQSQIDQLIAPSGSAPSAAEVENARIGSDGTVYPTLGDAIRTQNSDLKSHLTEIFEFKRLDSSNVEDGYINTSGVYDSWSNYKCTDFVDVTNVRAVEVKTAVSGSAAVLVFYDQYYRPLLDYVVTDSHSGAVGDYTAVVPTAAKYFRASCKTANISSFLVKYVQYKYDFAEMNDDINLLMSERTTQGKILYSQIVYNYKFGYSMKIANGAISFVTSNFRQVNRVIIEPNTGYFITDVQCTEGDNTEVAWAVTDVNDALVGYGVATPYGQCGMYVPPFANAYMLYFVAPKQYVGCIYKDNGKFCIYDGDKVAMTQSGGIGHSTNNEINGNDTTVYTVTNAITFSFSARYANSVGLWLRFPYTESEKIAYLTIQVKNGSTVVAYKPLAKNGLKMLNWYFWKLPVQGTSQIDSIAIIPTYESGYSSFSLEVADVAIFDQYSRPIFGINFDGVWESTYDCGVYSWLSDNNVPYTITGKVLSDGTAKMDTIVAMLMAQSTNGLLDIGLYGNEEYDQYYNCNNADFAQTCRIFENVLTRKLAQNANVITFGTGAMNITPNIMKALETYKFKITRTKANGTAMGLFEKGESIKVINEVDFNNATDLMTAVRNGGIICAFTHAISSDGAGTYEIAKDETYLNKILWCRTYCGMKVLNMKQLAEYCTNN